MKRHLSYTAVVAAFILVLTSLAPSVMADKAKDIDEQIRRALVNLPYYTVFDALAFRRDGAAVILEGKVMRPTLKKAAEAVVKRLDGVDVVENNIEVLPVSPNDDRIRRAAFVAIYGHPNFTKYAIRAVPPIHIIVERGHITLEGVVANETDKNFANILTNGVAGAFSVTNNLIVEK